MTNLPTKQIFARATVFYLQSHQRQVKHHVQNKFHFFHFNGPAVAGAIQERVMTGKYRRVATFLPDCIGIVPVKERATVFG